MSGPHPTRRRLLHWASLMLGTLSVGRLGAQEAPSDRGIGGTGAAPGEDRGHQGIGGTGVVGTIRRFGSIVVNDMRIGYAPDVRVTIDGRAARLADLRLGHVVRTAALAEGDRLVTRAIAVTSEVIGPLMHQAGHQLTILGQTIDVGEMAHRPVWRRGERLRIGGLRRPDGVVVASLVEPTRERLDRIAGTVELAGGTLRIGRLPLRRVDPALAGQRVVLRGHASHGLFVASSAEPEVSLLRALMADRLSLEVFLERRGNRLHLGSGLAVDDAAAVALVPDRAIVRAVVSASLQGGRVVVDRVAVVDRAGHDTGPSHGGTGAAPAEPPAHPGPGEPRGGPGAAGPAGGFGPGGPPPGQGAGGPAGPPPGRAVPR